MWELDTVGSRVLRTKAHAWVEKRYLGNRWKQARKVEGW